MLPLAYAAIAGGALLLVAGLTGSTITSVAKGAPDKANAAGPQVPEGAATPAGSTSTPGAGGPPAPVDARGLANPVPGFTKGRTDQGVDYSGRPGQPIYAIGPGRVLGYISNWFQGQPLVYYEITSGALKGRVIYVAEQIAVTVKPGQQLRAGQQIGHYAPSGTGLELGYATHTGQTLAQATTGYTEGQETPAGKAFRELLGRL